MAGYKIKNAEFLNNVAYKTDIDIKIVQQIYKAIIDEICKELADGNSVALSKFGTFYLQTHKGHPVQFKENEVIDDYICFKFKPSHTRNKWFRQNIERMK